MGPVPTTSATGGSAASQAESLDARAWSARPWTARFLRLVMFLGPLFGGFVAVSAATRIVERPGGIPLTVVWLVLLVGVSAAGAQVVQNMTMRLAPLSALFRLSLVFPDEAPSRFSVALRRGNVRRLEEKRAVAVASEQAAAEHLLALVAELSTHDRLTRGHSERVRAYSVMLGEEIGLSKVQLDRLNWAALIHDVGKLHVPTEVLNKPGRPTEEEWAVLRGHPGAAAQHVEALRPWLGDWVDAATQHHERYDGKGYPNGLQGEEISLAGRLVAIADAFDVMTAARSYKAPLPPEQARAELLQCAGSQFDPALVRAFLRVSLGRTRWVAGPLGWLSHFPEMVRAPVAAAASSGQAVVAAAAVTLAATGGAVLTPTEAEAGAERVVDDVVVAVVDTTSTSAVPDGTTSVADGSPPTTPIVPGDESVPTAVAPGDESNPTSTVAPGDDGSSPSSPSSPAAPNVSTSTVPSGVDPSSPSSPTSPATPTTTAPSTTTTTTTTPTTTTTTTTTTAPPVTLAVDDVFTVTSPGNTTLRVVLNDDFGSSSADPATLEMIGSVHHGVITVVGVNFRYTLNSGETSGTETFSYSVCSHAGTCDTATVNVVIDLS